MNNYDIRLWYQSTENSSLKFSNGIDVSKLEEVINELVQRIEELERKVNE